MPERRISARDLVGKVTDVHSHIGISVQSYGRFEFPYCQSIEGLRYRHKANGVDYGVVFPLSPGLYFDLPTQVREGRLAPGDRPLSGAPYEHENRMLFAELFHYCPEHQNQLLPFVCIDPGREIRGQLLALCALEREFPIYGVKISPVLCQSPVIALLQEGEPLLDFARDRGLPILMHVTVHPEEVYSQVADAFRVIERHPELRFCLAHCAGLSRRFLEQADAAPNVWVDTSALKIQVQLAHENHPIMAPPPERFDWDYADYRQVLRELVHCFPRTIVWGTDSPAYSYIARRLQGAGHYTEFRLKATYEDEKAALDALDPAARELACSTNASAFLFGETLPKDGHEGGTAC